MICAFLKLKARPVLQQNRDVGGSTVLILMSVPFRLIPPGSILATCATQGVKLGQNIRTPRPPMLMTL